MGWAGITLTCLLSIPFIFLFLAWLLRFRFAAAFEFPHRPAGSFIISFLWIKKVFAFANDETEDPEDDNFGEHDSGSGESGPPGDSKATLRPRVGIDPKLKGQAGFLGVDVPRRMK